MGNGASKLQMLYPIFGLTFSPKNKNRVERHSDFLAPHTVHLVPPTQPVSDWGQQIKATAIEIVISGIL